MRRVDPRRLTEPRWPTCLLVSVGVLATSARPQGEHAHRDQFHRSAHDRFLEH